jgi:Tfp pilus assembly ATPase PilU
MTAQDVALLLTALTGLVSAILAGTATIFAAMAKYRCDETTAHLVKVADDVKVIEKATNSMKDALVKATGEASLAAGADAERS